MTGQRSPHGLRRLIWTAAWILLIAISWVALAMQARRSPSPSVQSLDLLFGLTLVITYLGLWSLAILFSTSRRLMLLRMAMTTGSIVVILLILELAAAWRLVRWDAVFREIAGEGRDPRSAYIEDPQLWVRHIPGLRWSGAPRSDIENYYRLPRSKHKILTFTYDDRGYRNPAEMTRADVVLIGDSYVEGHYVSDDETVARQLARSAGVQVANLGVAGYGTEQALQVLKTDAASLEPEVIAWFFFEGNDFGEDSRFRDRFNRDETEAGWYQHDPWIKRSFIMNALARSRDLVHFIAPSRAPYVAWLATPDGEEPTFFFSYRASTGGWREKGDGRAWSKAKKNFAAGSDFCRRHGIELTLFYVPTKFRVYQELLRIPDDSPLNEWQPWSLPEQFLDFCAAESLSCVDLTVSLTSAAERGVHVYPMNDTHWSAEGHAVVAGIVAKSLQQSGAVREGTAASDR